MNPKKTFLFTLVFWVLAGFVLYFSFSLEMPSRFAAIKAVGLSGLGFFAALLHLLIWFREPPDNLKKKIPYLVLVFFPLVAATTALGNFAGFIYAGLDYQSFMWVYYFHGVLELGLVMVLFLLGAFFWKRTLEKNGYQKVFSLERQKKITLVPVSEVFFIRSADDYVAFNTKKGEFLKRDSIKALAETLDPDRFIRVHRNAIVNLSAIKAITPEPKGDFYIELQNGETLRGSRRFKAALKEKISSA